MGKTPGKISATGRRVVERMRAQGRIVGEGPLLRGNPNDLQLVLSSGELKRIDETIDMAHTVAAVTWWNSIGYKYGRRSPEVREFMLNADNYVLQEQSSNRSEGARMKERYREAELGLAVDR